MKYLCQYETFELIQRNKFQNLRIPLLFFCSFLEGSVVDHRDVKLQSVKLRYADEKLYKVSEIQVKAILSIYI